MFKKEVQANGTGSFNIKMKQVKSNWSVTVH